jgi:UDP-N-acetylmuramoyl-tripeptide--D-alanyl-D-alanine ligase
VALSALANLETYSALDEADERRGPLLDTLEGFVRFVLAARAEDGRFHSRYDVDSGESHGPPSPYFDGESLLLLVHAAKRLDRSDLRAAALQAAEAGYQLNVREALDDDPDSSVTKGYYQWSSMAYYALAESGWPDTERYGGRLLELADWMIDVHRTLARERNTAYAYEGIVPAYAWANAHGDARSAKLGCVIEQGLSKLLSWQVGSPLANAFIAEQPTYDPRAIGGVQNHKSEPGLRIDVAQHQLHALMLARELYLAR